MTDIKNNRGEVNENLSPSELKRKPNTQYVLSISYGKDSLACLGAIEKLGLPLDRIIHAEIWATDDIPADLPPMIEFKKKADKIIKQRFGIEVEHYYAEKREGVNELTKTFSTAIGTVKSMEGESVDSPGKDSHGVTPDSKQKPLKMPKITYEKIFYRKTKKGRLYGFPSRGCPWCTGELKIAPQKFFLKAPIHRALR